MDIDGYLYVIQWICKDIPKDIMLGYVQGYQEDINIRQTWISLDIRWTTITDMNMDISKDMVIGYNRYLRICLG